MTVSSHSSHMTCLPFSAFDRGMFLKSSMLGDEFTCDDIVKLRASTWVYIYAFIDGCVFPEM